MYEEFQNKIQSAMDNHIPSKILTKTNLTPWINRFNTKVKRLHKHKQRAYNNYKNEENCYWRKLWKFQ